MADAATHRQILTVSELNASVRYLLEDAYRDTWVEGEISNLSRPASGHWYFTLKDDGAQVRCAMFRGNNRRVRIDIANGLRVQVRCAVGLFEARGEFQLVVQHLEHAGAGALAAAFQALKERLGALGLFDPETKQPLPTPCRHLAVVTSPTGAAIRDIQRVLAVRCPTLPVTVIPAVVQGPEAPTSLINAIRSASMLTGRVRGDLPPIDLVLLARGGGSLEDLWAFNHEGLARVIANCPLPIITGIGHETDLTIADLVADVSAPTPSAAVAAAVPDQAEWLASVADLGARLVRSAALFRQARARELMDWRQRLRSPERQWQALAQQVDDAETRLTRMMAARFSRLQENLLSLQPRLQHPGRRLAHQQEELAMLASRLAQATSAGVAQQTRVLDDAARRLRLQSPARVIAAERAALAEASSRLGNAVRQRERNAHRALAGVAAQLGSVSPLNVLERGYAVLRDADGKQDTADARKGSGTIGSIHELRNGQRITAWLRDGAATLRVEQTDPSPPLGLSQSEPEKP